MMPKIMYKSLYPTIISNVMIQETCKNWVYEDAFCNSNINQSNIFENSLCRDFILKPINAIYLKPQF